MSTTVSYKGDTLTTVNNATKTLLTSGKYMEDDLTLVDVTSGGGGSSKETGSFVASSPLDEVTIPVTSKKSNVRFYVQGFAGNMDLTGAPLGTNNLVYFEAIEDLMFSEQTIVNYAGTAIQGSSDAIRTGSSGANRVSFNSTSIVIEAIRASGMNRPMIDGATYDWEAW